HNSIHDNTALGIDLSPSGVTPNDPGDPDTGANNLQNFPVLASASSSGGSTTITGSIDSTTANSAYPITIEFFSNPSCDSSGNGQGQTFLGSFVQSAGPGTFTATLGVEATPGHVVTATATDANGNTSEFSNCVTDTCANPTFTITCPADVTAVAGASCPVASSKTVTFPAPTATVHCGDLAIVCNPPSGSTFPVGTTTVNCTATDALGNSANCSFMVTVDSFCLQDETNLGNFVLINAATGDYSFFCNGVLIASGRGTLNVKGCEGTIEHVKGDRRVLISWDTTRNSGKGAGTAIAKLGPNTTKCQITDKDMSNNNCAAGGEA